MKIKYPLLLLIIASLLLVECKKEVAGCTDSNAFNYDPDADLKCCCEYTIQFDPEGTGGPFDVSYTNESGSTTVLTNVPGTWLVEYVVTIGASYNFTVTNKSTDSSTTAIANVWKGSTLLKTDAATGTGATASVSGIVN